MAARKTPARRPWAGRMEQRSLAVPPELLQEGAENWRAVAGDVAFQARLARELCVTRGAELTLAYRNLVWLLPGFRQTRGRTGHRLSAALCVVLVVRRKGSVPDGHAQALPRALLIYADHGGQHKLFAVPTDVQDAAGFAAATAHADSGLWVRRSNWPFSPGSFTCLVVLSQPGEADLTCLLSAQHVLTPYADADASGVDDQWPVLPRQDNGKAGREPLLARTLPYGGVLRDEREGVVSFDVQLALADQQLIPRIALRRFHPERPWVTSMAELLALDSQATHAFLLLTPDNHADPRGEIPLSLSLLADDAEHSTVVSIRYKLSRDNEAVRCTVAHDGLLAFESDGSRFAAGGDSGSPVVFTHPDGTMTLVGMHIAGNGAGMSWAIPAWQLFDLSLWTHLPPGASLTPMDAPEAA